jgi:hypothetical protein
MLIINLPKEKKMYNNFYDWNITKIALSVFIVLGGVITGFSFAFGGCIFILFILFLALKLANIIFWSWWLVFSPFWGPIVFVFLLGCITIIPAFIVDLILIGWNKIKGNKK